MKSPTAGTPVVVAAAAASGGGDLLSQLRDATGNATLDETTGNFFLEMCEGNVEMAATLYREQNPTTQNSSHSKMSPGESSFRRSSASNSGFTRMSDGNDSVSSTGQHGRRRTRAAILPRSLDQEPSIPLCEREPSRSEPGGGLITGRDRGFAKFNELTGGALDENFYDAAMASMTLDDAFSGSNSRQSSASQQQQHHHQLFQLQLQPGAFHESIDNIGDINIVRRDSAGSGAAGTTQSHHQSAPSNMDFRASVAMAACNQSSSQTSGEWDHSSSRNLEDILEEQQGVVLPANCVTDNSLPKLQPSSFSNTESQQSLIRPSEKSSRTLLSTPSQERRSSENPKGSQPLTPLVPLPKHDPHRRHSLTPSLSSTTPVPLTSLCFDDKSKRNSGIGADSHRDSVASTISSRSSGIYDNDSIRGFVSNRNLRGSVRDSISSSGRLLEPSNIITEEVINENDYDDDDGDSKPPAKHKPDPPGSTLMNQGSHHEASTIFMDDENVETDSLEFETGRTLPATSNDSRSRKTAIEHSWGGSLVEVEEPGCSFVKPQSSFSHNVGAKKSVMSQRPLRASIVQVQEPTQKVYDKGAPLTLYYDDDNISNDESRLSKPWRGIVSNINPENFVEESGDLSKQATATTQPTEPPSMITSASIPAPIKKAPVTKSWGGSMVETKEPQASNLVKQTRGNPSIQVDAGTRLKQGKTKKAAATTPGAVSVVAGKDNISGGASQGDKVIKERLKMKSASPAKPGVVAVAEPTNVFHGVRRTPEPDTFQYAGERRSPVLSRRHKHPDPPTASDTCTPIESAGIADISEKKKRQMAPATVPGAVGVTTGEPAPDPDPDALMHDSSSSSRIALGNGSNNYIHVPTGKVRHRPATLPGAVHAAGGASSGRSKKEKTKGGLSSKGKHAHGKSTDVVEEPGAHFVKKGDGKEKEKHKAAKCRMDSKQGGGVRISPPPVASDHATQEKEYTKDKRQSRLHHSSGLPGAVSVTKPAFEKELKTAVTAKKSEGRATGNNHQFVISRSSSSGDDNDQGGDKDASELLGNDPSLDGPPPLSKLPVSPCGQRKRSSQATAAAVPISRIDRSDRPVPPTNAASSAAFDIPKKFPVDHRASAQPKDRRRAGFSDFLKGKKKSKDDDGVSASTKEHQKHNHKRTGFFGRR